MRISGSRILLLAGAIGLAACASKESTLVKGQHPAAVVQGRQPQVSSLRRKVVSLLEKKNYRQAIELMNGKNREGLEREYIQALNGLLEAGDEAFSSEDYGTAAKAFKVVLKAYPVEPALRDRIGHDPKRIRALLDTCVDRMMEQALEEYRRGRLENAIKKWKVLLTVSPGNLEAKKALDTATVQLENMKNM